MEPRRWDWNFVIFLFQWCKELKTIRIFNKKCEEKNSLRNTCSGNYGKRWFQMLSALFYVNTCLQSFHEEERYYLFWFKALSTECIFLLFTVKAVSLSILQRPVSYKSAQTWELSNPLSCLHRQTLFVSCPCKNFPKGVSFITRPKSHTSQRFLQLKLWSNTSNRVPTETELTEIGFLQDFTLEHTFRIIKSSSLLSSTTDIKGHFLRSCF